MSTIFRDWYQGEAAADVLKRLLDENNGVLCQIWFGLDMLYDAAEVIPEEDEYVKLVVRVIRMKSKMEGRKNERQKMDEGSPRVADTRHPGSGSEGCEF